MSDEELTMLIVCLWAVTAYAAYLRLFVVRRLRKQVDKFVDSVLESPAQAARPVQKDPDNPQVDQLKERIKVLERIVTDGNPMLDHELEALRRA